MSSIRPPLPNNLIDDTTNGSLTHWESRVRGAAPRPPAVDEMPDANRPTWSDLHRWGDSRVAMRRGGPSACTRLLYSHVIVSSVSRPIGPVVETRPREPRGSMPRTGGRNSALGDVGGLAHLHLLLENRKVAPPGLPPPSSREDHGRAHRDATPNAGHNKSRYRGCQPADRGCYATAHPRCRSRAKTPHLRRPFGPYPVRPCRGSSGSRHWSPLSA